jgi:hypothetical protein
MSGEEFFANQRNVTTPSGNISYLAHGKNGRIFFPEERASDFNREVRAHWVATSERESK